MNKNTILAVLCTASLTMHDPRRVATDDGAGNERQELAWLAPAPEGPRIEPGTPEIYRRPYLSDYTPVAIYRDGRQVYEGLPMMVRQADGTVRPVACWAAFRPTRWGCCWTGAPIW